MAKKGKYAPKQEQAPQPESPGQFLIAIGGLVGFSATFLCARMVAQEPWQNALFFATLACFVAALVMKRIAVYLEKNIDRVRRERYEAERQRRRKAEEEEMRALENEMVQESLPSEDSPPSA